MVVAEEEEKEEEEEEEEEVEEEKADIISFWSSLTDPNRLSCSKCQATSCQ